MNAARTCVPIILWPIYAIFKLVEWILRLTVRLIAAVLGLAIMIVGAVLTVTIVAAPVGAPMILFGLMRLLLRAEYQDFNWKAIDKVMICYCICATLILTIQTGSSRSFINRLGFSFDALGMYFLFRCLIRNW